MKQDKLSSKGERMFPQYGQEPAYSCSDPENLQKGEKRDTRSKALAQSYNDKVRSILDFFICEKMKQVFENHVKTDLQCLKSIGHFRISCLHVCCVGVITL